MIKKIKILKEMIDNGIVAVLRASNQNEAESVTKECINGGVKLIEITFSTPEADIVIKNLKKKFQDSIIIGAGTVLDEVTARIAILAGAEFIVAPNFNKEVALICNMYGIPYIPGCMTVNEIVESMKYGVDIVKLFPANQFGFEYIKSLKAPLPQVNFMVTGGINLENVNKWIESGAAIVGIGGNLTSVKNNDYSNISELAKKYIREINIAKK